jgi:hypothetical protein
MIILPLHAPNFQLVLRLVHPPGKMERFVFNCFKAIAIRSLKILYHSPTRSGMIDRLTISSFPPYYGLKLGCFTGTISFLSPFLHLSVYLNDIMIGLILPAQPGAPSINGSQLLAHLHFYSVPNPTKPSLVLPLLAISLPTIII